MREETVTRSLTVRPRTSGARLGTLFASKRFGGAWHRDGDSITLRRTGDGSPAPKRRPRPRCLARSRGLPARRSRAWRGHSVQLGSPRPCSLAVDGIQGRSARSSTLGSGRSGAPPGSTCGHSVCPAAIPGRARGLSRRGVATPFRGSRSSGAWRSWCRYLSRGVGFDHTHAHKMAPEGGRGSGRAGAPLPRQGASASPRPGRTDCPNT